jgi:maleylpyruvate isomerase
MTGGYILHGAVRSSAAWRARIALELKGVAYTEIRHDLHKGEQNAADYRAINPQQLVPALQCPNGAVHLQSLAIIDYLEEAIPSPPLLPHDIDARADARALAQIIACDIHPINNIRVRNHVRDLLPGDPDAMTRWMNRWSKEGFDAIEALLAASPHVGEFSFGGAPGYVECFLVPQVGNARSMGRDISAYKIINRIAGACSSLPAFRKADPANFGASG